MVAEKHIPTIAVLGGGMALKLDRLHVSTSKPWRNYNDDHAPPLKLHIQSHSKIKKYLPIISALPPKIKIPSYYASIILNANSPRKCTYSSKIMPE